MLAQRLPVFPIPEKSEVATVRIDVIDYGCWYYMTSRQVVGAKGMVQQKLFAGCLPLATVATLGRGFSFHRTPKQKARRRMPTGFADALIQLGANSRLYSNPASTAF